MQSFIDAVDQAVKQKNWYAALTIALTLPDICGDLEGLPKNRPRYVTWFDRYLAAEYAPSWPGSTPDDAFLTGSDFYALRCAVLHQGSEDISDQKAQETLTRFMFVTVPGPNICIHCNRRDDQLQLQVDVFCREITNGARRWLTQVAAVRPDVMARMDRLVNIRDVSKGFSF